MVTPEILVLLFQVRILMWQQFAHIRLYVFRGTNNLDLCRALLFIILSTRKCNKYPIVVKLYAYFQYSTSFLCLKWFLSRVSCIQNAAFEYAEGEIVLFLFFIAELDRLNSILRKRVRSKLSLNKIITSCRALRYEEYT